MIKLVYVYDSDTQTYSLSAPFEYDWETVLNHDTIVVIELRTVDNSFIEDARVISVNVDTNEIRAMLVSNNVLYNAIINPVDNSIAISKAIRDVYISLAQNLSAADVGTYGENAYIFIDKTADANGGLFFEWDVEILDNYTDYLNFTVLGNRNHENRNNLRIVLGGAVGNDNTSAFIYNFGSQGENDTPLVAISNFYGYVISDNDAQKIEIPTSGRYQFLLGDTVVKKNNNKFAIFALYDYYHNNFSGVNYGYIYGRCPALYAPFFRLYSLKIWSDESKTTLLHHYVPMVNEENHKGVYDNVAQAFYACSNDDFFVIDN